MFTGIIEEIGQIKNVQRVAGNIHLTVLTQMAGDLKIDQSVSHNGICLTVVSRTNTEYIVTAIKETIDKTTIGDWQIGDSVNLERGLKLGDRLDGHMVQGHVDQIGVCTKVQETNGSWSYRFQYEPSLGNITIEKGSITINGVSLTVINSERDAFSVAIIPYTYDHTNFSLLKVGAKVNLEFDVIGKYVSRLYQT
jgi:riboflavin synthase